MKRNGISLFVFRRDLRLEDNSGLIHALNSSEKVIPIFILDKYLIKNKNLSFNAKQFLKDSVLDLLHKFNMNNSRLFIYHDKPEIIIKDLLNREALGIDRLIMNRDYTPYSHRRDTKIRRICSNTGTKLIITADLLLNEPEVVKKGDRTPYSIFTPFFKKSQIFLVNEPVKAPKNTYYNDELFDTISMDQLREILNYYNPNIWVKGGRTKGLELLDQIQNHKNYQEQRDFPAITGTTHLSAHLKFGTVSIREVYHAIKQSGNYALLRQLYWRDFYIYIGFHFPHVFNGSFRPKYDKLDWTNDKGLFQAWCEGKTGFPIVDAGMRQLNATGWMHNRVRMIVASFLTKDLLINWQLGEKYFKEKLVDYDISVNNGNWQWAASTGCDPVPYFRIFNPWLQQKKFDPQCDYIKQYIPELRGYDPKIIHNLYQKHPKDLEDYPYPIVDHKIMREKAKTMFKTI
ncbi:MAG: deoxyribodipyrimidine photo-lyase [Candidatus Heimdallarchaeota archaeon]|nr:MAG: deoxyribodipyrimidine photo-lyase [Candidatus Heimdallarchaeota archaeon]